MIVQEYDLTEEEATEIQAKNAKLVSIRNLIATLQDPVSTFVYEKLITSLADFQLEYDKWFTEMETKHTIETTTDNQWNVDFAEKKLQLLRN